MTRLKVSSQSDPKAVAGAFAGVVREAGRAEVLVVGAGALNQAVKAVALARSYLADLGIDLVCVPGFDTVDIAGERRTALRLIVEDGCAAPAALDAVAGEAGERRDARGTA